MLNRFTGGPLQLPQGSGLGSRFDGNPLNQRRPQMPGQQPNPAFGGLRPANPYQRPPMLQANTGGGMSAAVRPPEATYGMPQIPNPMVGSYGAPSGAPNMAPVRRPAPGQMPNMPQRTALRFGQGSSQVNGSPLLQSLMGRPEFRGA